MKILLSIIFFLSLYIANAQPQNYSTANAHSHNDYEQPTPFWTAYHEGFGSIEADIFLQNDSLLVAHDLKGLSLGRTLKKYYLDPLDSCIKKNAGYVYADHKKTLQLLIDVKTIAVPTLNKLIEVLGKYPNLTNAKTLSIVISGNRPDPISFETYPKYIQFDGVLSVNYSAAALDKISMLSDYVGYYVKGQEITNEEIKNLTLAISKAHLLKKTVRFWATPDKPDVWKKFMDLKVDFINTDHINALADYLKGGVIATIGKALPEWKKGFLDLHHINTGRGNAAYFIFPDSTNMIMDAGESDTSDERTLTPRNTAIHPNNSKLPFQWISYYINKVTPFNVNHLDYAVVSHFHEDHFGGWYANAPKSSHGNYLLSGITGVNELIPYRHLLDRGYPNYDFPVPFEKIISKTNGRETKYYKTMNNYFSFIKSQQGLGMITEHFKAGVKDQITLQHHPIQYPEFYIQQVKSNGEIWTGKDNSAYQFFPTVDTANVKTWPDENSLSLVLTMNYGPFKYYTGGDCAGNVFYGDASWCDVETPVAKVIGEVDVATMDHHGNRDAVNEFQIKTFKPSAWIEQVWSADHPGHEVLIRLTTPYLNTTPKDLFATNMLNSNKYVIGPLIDKSYKSQQGHILVRVLPGGNDYYIIILDDSNADMLVKNVFGPYRSKSKN
jgi:hypothetical protein